MTIAKTPMTRLPLVLPVLAALSSLAQSASAQTPAPRRLSLAEAARLAAVQTATVESAQLRVQQAQARVTQLRAALLPHADLIPNWTSHTTNSASIGFNIPSPPGQPPVLDPNGEILGPVRMWDFRGQVSQTVFDAVAKQRVRAARASVDATSAEVATTAESSASNAAVMYVRALRTDAILQARIADSSLAAELLGIARAQLAGEVGVALDVTRAQSQLVGARMHLVAARNDRERSRLDLRRALNLPFDTPIELTDSLATLPKADAITEVAAVDLALRNRPDIRTADLQLEAAQQHLAATRASRLPRVSVFGNDGLNGKTTKLFNTYAYGIQLSWSALEGGRRQGETQEHEAIARDIDVRRRDLRQQVELDVRSAMLELTSAAEQVDAARERQSLAEQEVQQARERFGAGVASNADVITASLSLNNARTALIDALTAYQIARVSLARAEGMVTQLR